MSQQDMSDLPQDVPPVDDVSQTRQPGSSSTVPPVDMGAVLGIETALEIIKVLQAQLQAQQGQMPHVSSTANKWPRFTLKDDPEGWLSQFEKRCVAHGLPEPLGCPGVGADTQGKYGVMGCLI
jgi:hypothetical protein